MLLLALSLVLPLSGGASAADWTLETLGRALAAESEGPVPFTERREVAYLDEPLLLSGYVRRDGARLEKHVLDPKRESIVFDGDTVRVRAEDGTERTLNIDDHPLIRGLAVALRATLTGAFDRLTADFEVSLSGPRDDWTLILAPRADTIRAEIERVALTGAAGRVRTIRIEAAEGGSSVMTLLHDDG